MTRTNRDETECHESFGRRNGVSTCVRCLASRPARRRNAELAVGRERISLVTPISASI